MYDKIIVCDISGTLLDSTGRIDNDLIKNLNILKNNNIGFILCSGGARIRTLELAKTIGASDYIISSNGANVYCENTKSNIYSNYIDRDTVIKIYELAQKYDFRIALNSEDLIYSNKLIYDSNYERKIFYENNFFSLLTNIVQCIVSGKNSKNFIEFLDKLKYIPDIEIAIKNISGNNIDINNIKMCYSDIVKIGTSKGIGLKELCNYIKIDKQNVIAIGDSSNDLSLFDYAGYTVAMGNAIDELKEKSNYITKDNNNNGVNEFLKTLIKRM